MEQLGFWLAHEAYHIEMNVPRPGPLLDSRGFVCWSEMGGDVADAIAAVGMTRSEIGSKSSIKNNRGQQRTIRAKGGIDNLCCCVLFGCPKCNGGEG